MCGKNKHRMKMTQIKSKTKMHGKSKRMKVIVW